MINSQPTGYESRTLNQWIDLAKTRPVPRLLFGEFWLEGELAVMFGDTGAGKSLLAVQIAESIARGREIEPFEIDAKPQQVLYFDFELSEKQLELRYTKDHKPGLSSLIRHYRFSERFHRIKVDLNAPLPDGVRNFDEYLIGVIKQRISETGAKVVIIDNVLHMKRSYGSASDAIRLMNKLNHLKATLGLSILLVAHSRKRAASRTLGTGEQVSAKVIASLADSVFAIGNTSGSPSGRYLKHLKTRSTEMVYDESNVPVFTIRKMEDNFLGFAFQRFDDEETTHYQERHPREDEMIGKIVEMSDRRMSIRSIAAALDMSRSTVHRLLKMSDQVERRPVRRAVFEPTNYHPAHKEEEFVEIENTNETGWSADTLVRIGGSSGEIPLATIGGRRSVAHADKSVCAPFNDEGFRHVVIDDRDEEESEQTELPGPALILQRDGYGRDILVESEDERGRPAVWYQTNRQGITNRYERQGFVISVQQAAPA
ncbi:MAG TPA: AAA family ATPase [Pyrinomonadaceae bacterium]|nr:AAA family ATPase [Pyrinomonadaceae bacterium]